jgi:excisionase family DNA binding protein
MSDERLLSTAELAEWLGATVGTIQRWAKAGEIRPALRLPGGEYRWDRSEVREQLAPKGESVGDVPNRPSVITAIVTSPQGVLIGHRHDGKPPWTFIAGEQEPGETFADTIIREVKEETGLEIMAGDILGERVHPKTGRHMVYVAARPARMGELDVTVGDPDELSEVRWTGLAEADELLPGMFEPVKDHLTRTLTN